MKSTKLEGLKKVLMNESVLNLNVVNLNDKIASGVLGGTDDESLSIGGNDHCSNGNCSIGANDTCTNTVCGGDHMSNPHCSNTSCS